MRLPTADSLCSLKVARASKISGRKFSAAARRKPARLDVCRNGCAERQRGGAQWLSPRRAPFGRKASPPWAGVPPDAVRPRLPGDRTARLRRHDPQLRSPLPSHRAVSPRVERIARLGVLVLAGPWSRALFSQQQANGDVLRCWHAGTVRCRWARLPRVDPLCDRMERGEEEATDGPPHCISAQPFLQMLRPVGFRRAAAENFRPEIFEARATLREQSGSTLGRRDSTPHSVPVCQESRNVPINPRRVCSRSEPRSAAAAARTDSPRSCGAGDAPAA